MAKIWVRNLQRQVSITATTTRRIATAILNALGLHDHELSILLLNDAYIADLNQRYLQRSGPTDVISFPMRDRKFPSVQPSVLGDVVVSVERAFDQAQDRNVPLEYELARLLIHGVLHLIGYDHEGSDRQERSMRRYERIVFNKVKHTMCFSKNAADKRLSRKLGAGTKKGK